MIRRLQYWLYLRIVKRFGIVRLDLYPLKPLESQMTIALIIGAGMAFTIKETHGADFVPLGAFVTAVSSDVTIFTATLSSDVAGQVDIEPVGAGDAVLTIADAAAGLSRSYSVHVDAPAPLPATDIELLDFSNNVVPSE